MLNFIRFGIISDISTTESERLYCGDNTNSLIRELNPINLTTINSANGFPKGIGGAGNQRLYYAQDKYKRELNINTLSTINNVAVTGYAFAGIGGTMERLFVKSQRASSPYTEYSNELNLDTLANIKTVVQTQDVGGMGGDNSRVFGCGGSNGYILEFNLDTHSVIKTSASEANTGYYGTGGTMERVFITAYSPYIPLNTIREINKDTFSTISSFVVSFRACGIGGLKYN